MISSHIKLFLILQSRVRIIREAKYHTTEKRQISLIKTGMLDIFLEKTKQKAQEDAGGELSKFGSTICLEEL